ncbi:polysaccharide deacetylase family protein [Fodinicola feengrottensis]|uniref:NodB homology domain-containing protein n=1 Tax=Fodinicola feengrottensis TaxID=435914 RepID=A0ABN2I2B7_9ACTN|nr:polysaccharide deacetylase family protein [Fodinicola feengrottensis]
MPATAEQRPHPRSKDCNDRDPIGKPVGTTALPDLPHFDKPPRPERVPIRPDPAWLGAGPPPQDNSGAVVVRDIPTKQKVVFITIDDGDNRDPRTEALLRKANVPVTVFLIGAVASCEPDYFRRLQGLGIHLEDHTEQHPNIAKVFAGRQRQQICGIPSKYQRMFGHRPGLFRPPFGYDAFNSTTLRVLPTCGLHYLVLWQVNVHGNNIVHLRRGVRQIEPGDIILLHFQDNFVVGFAKVLEAVKQAGLTPAVLQDYLPADGSVIAPSAKEKPGISRLTEPVVNDTSSSDSD